MNAHQAPPQRDHNERSKLAPVLGAVAAAAVVVGGVVVATQGLGDDGTPASESPSASASASASATPDGSETTASATPEADSSDSPGVSEDWAQAALDASSAGLPAMVPAGLPDGWQVESGEFTTDPDWWHLEVSAPAGTVAVDQTRADAAALVSQRVGTDAEPGDDVNLSRFGTGVWSAWSSSTESTTGLVYATKDTTVVVTGPDRASVTTLAKRLLTAEDAPIGGGGGD